MDIKQRIRQPKEHRDLMDRLIKTKNNEYGVFSSYAKLMLFSAALGYREKKRVAFESTNEPISITSFGENGRAFMYSLALAELDDIECFQDASVQNVMAIFEEYANGGFNYLDQILINDRGIHEQIEELLRDQDSKKNIPDLSDIEVF